MLMSFLRFKFDDFEHLSHERGRKPHSQDLADGNGNAWRLKIYPGGSDNQPTTGSSDEEDSVYVYLQKRSPGDANSTFSFTARNAKCGMYKHVALDMTRFEGFGEGIGSDTFLKRSEVLDKANSVLDDGALVIDVEIQILVEMMTFQPSNPHLKNILARLESGEDADIAFTIGDERILAHKLILKTNAPVLFDLCKNSDTESPLSIDPVKASPEVFRLVLSYVYGGKAPSVGEVEAMGKDIIRAADYFAIDCLKMEVETCLVKFYSLDVENVIGWLLFSDEMTCPLLKERVMSYYILRFNDIVAHESHRLLEKSPKLLTEVMVNSLSSANLTDSISKMGVDELRKKLDEKGLDIDGSKQALISRLKASNTRKRTD